MAELFIVLGFAGAGLSVFAVAAGLVYVFGGDQVRRDMRGE
jgi:predicted ribonuclease YlaK